MIKILLFITAPIWLIIGSMCFIWFLLGELIKEHKQGHPEQTEHIYIG